MDLMTNVTDYASLNKKYRGFTTPSYRILIDGTDIKEKLGAGINSLEVELTNGYEASGASFTVVEQYEQINTNFDTKGAFKQLQLGAKVVIELGYFTNIPVFEGIITEVSYDFDEDSSPTISVGCMDAKCLLMKVQRLEIRKEKKMSQVITAIFGEQPISGYLSGKEINLTSPDQSVIQMNMESDYNFIVKQAQYYGCEFFIIAGKAYFRSTVTVSAPIMTLQPGDGLRQARLSFQGSGLVNELEVVGINPQNDQSVSGKSKLAGKFSAGSTAKKMLSGTKRTYFDSGVTSVADAKKRADILADSIVKDFGLLEATSVGNPEIVPGRFIKIDGLMDDAKKNFYIGKVRHRYNASVGYITEFEGGIKSL